VPSYAALELIDPSLPDILPAPLRARLGYPTRREALIHTHFPPSGESLDALNTFRSPAQQRLIFEEFFLYQLSLALDRKNHAQRKRHRLSPSRKHIREALKRILPFKPTAAQNASSPKLPPTSKNPRP